MRIALLYPPPWKIPEAGEEPDLVDGPPPNFRPGDLDADFHQTPYGLFSLGAQAIRAGHDVKVLNLSAYSWAKTKEVVSQLDAQLFGMSCWTANRRGVKLVSELIRETHPNAHVVVGGPHATPLAKELLEHYPAVDTVCTGESEESFMELVDRVRSNLDTRGIAGTFYRDGGQVSKGPPRGAIHELDGLESPHRHFATHIVMTSRGCPWQCTFCGAETTWGRGFRGQTIPYVLDAIEAALARVPVKMLLLKDDTFTANKKRAMEICRGIRERKLNFLWSCDTRVDVLTEELLREMRLAGCQRLSLGVESGSQAILNAIDKKITPEKIIRAAEMAKKFGIQVRFYMMLGNRGETRQTFYETLDFLERAKPHQYLFSCLSVYPGTIDFHDAEKAGWLDRESYFVGNFQELKVPFEVTPEDAELFAEWFERNKGLQRVYELNAKTASAIVDELGDHHAAHMDLAGAYFAEGELDGAKRHAERTLELGTPVPGLAHNLLACIAAKRFDLEALQTQLRNALRLDPYHFVVAKNAEALRVWLKEGGPLKRTPLELDPHHEFQLFEKTQQPALPGPLPEGWSKWKTPGESPQAAYPTGPRRLSVVS
jgi:anaerobic magnesium-protoporphyrin IX monomethyl ester cyclase